MSNPGLISTVWVNGLIGTLIQMVPRFNNRFLSNAYFLDSNSASWDSFYLSDGIDLGDTLFFEEMRDFIVANPITTAANYKTLIDTYIDIDSFIDYVIIETFSACSFVRVRVRG